MANSSDPSRHHNDHHGEHPHDWHSSGYVSKWAEGQDQKESLREEPFRLMAETIPYDQQSPIRILDLGAGYGALTQFLLNLFPNATAVCQDNSREMAGLGHTRMDTLRGRFAYAYCDFSKQGWSKQFPSTFEAVVSAIAIHNVREPEIIRDIYQEIFPLVKKGGCFLNFEILNQPLENHIEWLGQAGFQDPRCFWKDEERRALFGGFKK
jgi:ubiquinone/menaquinone biosynthesis C-methylase UbiE